MVSRRGGRARDATTFPFGRAWHLLSDFLIDVGGDHATARANVFGIHVEDAERPDVHNSSRECSIDRAWVRTRAVMNFAPGDAGGAMG